DADDWCARRLLRGHAPPSLARSAESRAGTEYGVDGSAATDSQPRPGPRQPGRNGRSVRCRRGITQRKEPPMHRTITTKAFALVLGTIASVGLVSVPSGSASTPIRHCVKIDPAPLEAGRDYEVFPDSVELTMQSLQAALMRRDNQPVLASSAARSTAP